MKYELLNYSHDLTILSKTLIDLPNRCALCNDEICAHFCYQIDSIFTEILIQFHAKVFGFSYFQKCNSAWKASCARARNWLHLNLNSLCIFNAHCHMCKHNSRYKSLPLEMHSINIYSFWYIHCRVWWWAIMSVCSINNTNTKSNKWNMSHFVYVPIQCPS